MAKLRGTIVLTEHMPTSNQNAGPYEMQVVLTQDVCDIHKVKTNPETGRVTVRVIRCHRSVWDALVAGFLRDVEKRTTR